MSFRDANPGFREEGLKNDGRSPPAGDRVQDGNEPQLVCSRLHGAENETVALNWPDARAVLTSLFASMWYLNAA